MMLLLLTLLTAHAGTVRASSNHKTDDGFHTAAQAVDGSFRTAWAESASGTAKGEWLELDLGRGTALTNVAIWPGNLKTGSRSFREYSRPRTVQVLVDGKPQGDPVVLPNKMQRTVIPLSVTGRKIRIAIEDTFEGIVFNDTYIAEIAVNFPSGALRGWDNWLAGSDAKRRHAQFIQQLEAAYVKQKETEFGDKAAFQFLSDAVAEGPPYIRSRLSSLVPVGYRAQAVPASGQAHKALRNLKDANAIPAFEMAALRETGDAEAEISEVVQLLRAYQEMIGTANNNVAYWGETGWGLGALRSFGEPIAMDMDIDGNIYVADVGNNRVQRFTIDGKGERQWGPGADLANDWFGGARDWYVSGAKPGSKIGEFVNPLDVTVIPTKEGDGFAALDAAGRVQVFDSKGRPVVSWQLSTTTQPSPKLGGEGYLVYIPKQGVLVAILGDEGRVHSLDSAEISAWKIADGTPRSVEVSGKGQLLFGYGDRIVQYNPDGFRYGTVVTGDQLGRGHEDFDMAIDEKKRLWVLTDSGRVVKFKRPGVVEFAVDAIDRPLKHPRIEVKDGIVFYCSDDRIEQVDVLQARLDAEAAETEE